MKTLKLSIVALATLVFGAVIFISCSNEESTTNPDSSLTNFRITNANAFIDDFYRTSWTTGVSATVEDSLKAYLVTEIIVGTDTRARGYLVKDKATNELLYFADVNRRDYVFTTIDLISEKVETFLEIDRHSDYGHSNEFDIIKIIDDLGGVTQPSGWFWGKWNCTEDTVNFVIVPPTYDSEGIMTHPGDVLCKSTCELRRFGFYFGETSENWATCSWVTTPY